MAIRHYLSQQVAAEMIEVPFLPLISFGFEHIADGMTRVCGQNGTQYIMPLSAQMQVPSHPWSTLSPTSYLSPLKVQKTLSHSQTGQHSPGFFTWRALRQLIGWTVDVHIGLHSKKPFLQMHRWTQPSSHTSPF